VLLDLRIFICGYTIDGAQSRHQCGTKPKAVRAYMRIHVGYAKRHSNVHSTPWWRKRDLN